MRPTLPTVLLAAMLTVPAAHSPAAGWEEDIMHQACDPSLKSILRNEIRDRIEASVRRGEQAIEAPVPIGDLTCLKDLMTAPLDLFSRQSPFTRVMESMDRLAGAGLAIANLDLGQMICRYAEQKWAQLTAKIEKPLAELDRITSMLSPTSFNLSSGFTSPKPATYVAPVSSLGTVTSPTPAGTVTPPPLVSTLTTETGPSPLDVEDRQVEALREIQNILSGIRDNTGAIDENTRGVRTTITGSTDRVINQIQQSTGNVTNRLDAINTNLDHLRNGTTPPPEREIP